MARTQGQVNESIRKVGRHRMVDTRLKRAARALWG